MSLSGDYISCNRGVNFQEYILVCYQRDLPHSRRSLQIVSYFDLSFLEENRNSSNHALLGVCPWLEQKVGIGI